MFIMRNNDAGFRAILKFMAALVILFLYVTVSLSLLAATPGGKKRRYRLARVTSFCSHLIVQALGLRVAIEGQHDVNAAAGRLLVANHVSYTDVLAICSVMPCVFVTSVELKNTFFLGQLARLSGSLFVERRRPSGLKEEIEAISRVLAEGLSVVIFPEGTTSDGSRVMPFRKPLFDAAVRAGAGIIPVCLRYVAVNGAPLSPSSRDSVFYYGGIGFALIFRGF